MHTLKPIRSEEEYEAARARMRALLGAEVGTPAGDELDVLTAFVSQYEEKNYPVGLPDLVSAIEFRMDQAGLTRRDLIPYIGSRQKVSEILSGKRDLTMSMARALHQHLGIPAEVLLQRPGAEFDAVFAEIDPRRYPLRAMAQRGWIPELPDLADRAEELVRGLIERAGGPDFATMPLYRQNGRRRINAKSDPHALRAWCWRVLGVANANPPRAAYRPRAAPGEFIQFMRDVARLSVHEDGPRRARSFLAERGIALVIERHLPRTHLDGAALRLRDGRPVIGLTLRYDRIDNFWFSLMHELAHVGFHLDQGEDEPFLDDLSLRGTDPLEEEADRRAQDALIPPEIWAASPVREEASVLGACALAQEVGVHPAVIAGRVRHDRGNYRLLSQLVGSGKVRAQFEI